MGSPGSLGELEESPQAGLASSSGTPTFHMFSNYVFDWLPSLLNCTLLKTKGLACTKCSVLSEWMSESSPRDSKDMRELEKGPAGERKS